MMNKETDMKKYEIYQINLTNEMVEEVNSSQDALPEWYAKYTRTTFKPTVENVTDAIDMYKHVSNITSDLGLEHVFEIGNIGPENNIERFAPMHSLSIGDVVVDREYRRASVVASRGFEEVPYQLFQEIA